jgi:methylthioribose-1-phosphate isomerase
MEKRSQRFHTLVWQDDCLQLLDQRRLPAALEYIECRTAEDVFDAVQAMVVRGAPAIGIAAAYGVVLAAREAYRSDPERWQVRLRAAMLRLASARPTAVNLRWALDRMSARAMTLDGDPEPVLLAEAKAIHDQDVAANRTMGELGARLIDPGSRVLTHCNAGALATGGYGTALGVIRSAHTQGKLASVYATETRPWLQGARLTAWELLQDDIPVTLIADGAAPHLCRQKAIDWIIVGADRVAANGDVANKIGTYGLALSARYHGARFMVVAPLSTLDRDIASGDQIPIENRSSAELLKFRGAAVAAAGAGAWNPVFDVTPAELVTALVTEKGVAAPPSYATIGALFEA